VQPNTRGCLLSDETETVDGDTILSCDLQRRYDIYLLVHEQITRPRIPQRKKNYLTLLRYLLETRVNVCKQFIRACLNADWLVTCDMFRA
jgi:hypothetical protein